VIYLKWGRIVLGISIVLSEVMSYYQILQIHPQATQQEIKQSYRRLAKLFHPDTRTPSANKNKIIVFILLQN